MNFLEPEPESAQFFFSVIRDGESPETKSTFCLFFYNDDSCIGKASVKALGELTGKLFELENEKIWADSDISVSRRIEEDGGSKYILRFSGKEFIEIEKNTEKNPIIIKVLPIGKI